MSVKALENEYQKVFEQYQEMVNDIKDIEKDANEGLCDPELVDRLKEQIKPIKQNYEWWSYIMYILHQPQRKEKHKKYSQIKRKTLQDLSEDSNPDNRLSAGEKALTQLKGMRNGRTS